MDGMNGDFAWLSDENSQEPERTGRFENISQQMQVAEIVIECPVVIEFIGGTNNPTLAPDTENWMLGRVTEAIRQI